MPTLRRGLSSGTSSNFLQSTPTDTALSVFWHFNPRLLSQFLNRRLPFFFFRMFHHMEDSQDREVVIMRYKMSECAHIIQIRCKIWGPDKKILYESRISFIADGSLLRFELHGADVSNAGHGYDVWSEPQITFALVFIREAMLVKLHLLPGESENSRYTHFFDGKWKMPDDLVVCPRVYSNLGVPLMGYWHDEYYDLPKFLREKVKKVGYFLA
ncbi:hypothetical protein CJF31_00012169 [Rutstroemia sp. NJR-2017a BVV2]|nr:hypothetical protein CJF31_00012169 [Rutstroemia sp. NJR-2017a BVV2]